jgi:hypothetical protein
VTTHPIRAVVDVASEADLAVLTAAELVEDQVLIDERLARRLVLGLEEHRRLLAAKGEDQVPPRRELVSQRDLRPEQPPRPSSRVRLLKQNSRPQQRTSSEGSSLAAGGEAQTEAAVGSGHSHVVVVVALAHLLLGRAPAPGTRPARAMPVDGGRPAAEPEAAGLGPCARLAREGERAAAGLRVAGGVGRGCRRRLGEERVRPGRGPGEGIVPGDERRCGRELGRRELVRRGRARRRGRGRRRRARARIHPTAGRPMTGGRVV